MHDLAQPEKLRAQSGRRGMRPGLTIESAKSRLPVLAQRFNCHASRRCAEFAARSADPDAVAFQPQHHARR